MNRARPVGPYGGGWTVISNAEQHRDGDRRSRMAVEGEPRRDRGDDEAQASDAAEDAKGANEGVLGEILDQVLSEPAFRLRESLHLVDQDPHADPLQRLPRAVEDDERHQRDSADSRGGTFDAAQEQEDGNGHQGNEEHHPHVDHQEARHVVLRIQVDLRTVPAGME